MELPLLNYIATTLDVPHAIMQANPTPILFYLHIPSSFIEFEFANEMHRP